MASFRPDIEINVDSETERLLLGTRVLEAAVRLFDGDRDAAVDWLTKPQVAFGKAPVDLIHTEEGARDVERVIGALEHGIFL